MIRGDASEILALGRGLAAVSSRVTPVATAAMNGAATAIKTGWQANARATAGSHGKHYPNSITHDVLVAPGMVVAEIGPDRNRPQGGMGPGFEFGSVNQPAHLDGTKALTAAEPAAAKALEGGIARLLP